MVGAGDRVVVGEGDEPRRQVDEGEHRLRRIAVQRRQRGPRQAHARRMVHAADIGLGPVGRQEAQHDAREHAGAGDHHHRHRP